MTATQLAPPSTVHFSTLAAGAIVRVPPARGHLTAIVVMSPAAEVLTAPAPCPRCPALLVATRELESGREVEVHRLPDRPVLIITEEA